MRRAAISTGITCASSATHRYSANKDVVKLWKAEKFEPEALMRLYVAAGARYSCSGSHHDNFHNWELPGITGGTRSRWGPNRDIVGMWRDVARAHGLRFGLSEQHRAPAPGGCRIKAQTRSGRWAGVPYDGNDPAYEDRTCQIVASRAGMRNGIPATPGGPPNGSPYCQRHDRTSMSRISCIRTAASVDTVAATAIAISTIPSAQRTAGKTEAVYTQKDRNEQVYSVASWTFERSQPPDILPRDLADRHVLGHWFYDYRATYKTAITGGVNLVDVVSKNEEHAAEHSAAADGPSTTSGLYILECMARWIAVNGEGIYGTRPWRRPRKSVAGSHRDFKEDPGPPPGRRGLPFQRQGCRGVRLPR